MNDIEFLGELERRADAGPTVALTEAEYKQLGDVRGYPGVYLSWVSSFYVRDNLDKWREEVCLRLVARLTS